MMNPDGGSRSGVSLTSQVTLVVWLAQSVIDTLMGGRGGPEKRTTKINKNQWEFVYEGRQAESQGNYYPFSMWAYAGANLVIGRWLSDGYSGETLFPDWHAFVFVLLSGWTICETLFGCIWSWIVLVESARFLTSLYNEEIVEAGYFTFYSRLISGHPGPHCSSLSFFFCCFFSLSACFRSLVCKKEEIGNVLPYSSNTHTSHN